MTDLGRCGDGLVTSQPGESDVPREFWIAYYPDWSAVVVFTNELAALRYAVGASRAMWVGKILPGIPIKEQLA